MKNRLKYLLGFCSGALLLASSCTHELFDYPNKNNTPEGKVRLEMSINYVSDTQPVQSRASLTHEQEEGLVEDRVWILIFDNAATEQSRVLKQAPAKAQVIEDNKVYANLDPENSDSWVYVLANVTAAANTYLQGLSAGATLGTIMNSQAMKLTEATNSGLTNPFPMWGTTGTIVSQIKKGELLSATVSLIRAVARIDVVVDPKILPKNFTIKSVSVVNAAKSGWLFQQTPVPAQRLTDVIKYNPAQEVSSISVGSDNGSDNAIVNQIYCYENNGMIDATKKNITRIVIEGNYGGKTSSSFYGIDIAYKLQPNGTEEKYDIERNKVYTVRIKKIDKDGYASFDLAENSESFNSGVVAEVTVTDPYSHNIVSNGKQYMGTTNTNLLIYTKNPRKGETTIYAAKNILAATLSYTCANGWPQGTIKASNGITFVTSGTADETLHVASGATPIIRDILINIPSDFKEGTIEARIGNLSQVIRVINRRVTSSGGDIVDYFTTGAAGVGADTEKDFVVAEVINPSADNAWLKVSDDVSAFEPSSLFDKVTNPEGKVYLHVAGNIAYQNSSAADRKAQAFVTSKNNEQRWRIHIEQAYLDVYSDARPIKPYTYVGVFHRWNETAERLIRIEGAQTYQGIGETIIAGNWVASVVSGDFIMLSTQPSKDPNIKGQDPYGTQGVSNWTADQLEALGQFDLGEGCKVVTGTIDNKTPNIYFKVGLTGRLASFDAQPRYGLISIVYSTGSGATFSTQTQFIYVRQGEEADYLMRPSDPVIYTSQYYFNQFTQTEITEATNHPVPELFPLNLRTYLTNAKQPMATRPMARKLAPYNLRAIKDDFSGKQTVSLNDHQFVDYPSKGGDYYFNFGKDVVRKGTEIVSGGSTGNWKPSDSENCPTGYRRIRDHISDKAIAANSITVADSENRQSYWLFPMKFYYLSNFSNQIRGFLADGYFDRKQIEGNSSYDNPSYGHCIVKNGTIEVRDNKVQHAYWGYLVYNPYNYASVFQPLAGNYSNNGNSAPYKNEGVFAGILTSSLCGENSNNTSIIWITNYGKIGSVEVYDNYKTSGPTDAYNIRCIKDESDPVVGPLDGSITVTKFASGSGKEFYNVRIQYDQSTGSLSTQLTNSGVDVSKMNTLTVVCSSGKALQTADYTDLNNWAENSPTLGATNSLHHIVIRGAGNQAIPAGAFTSKYWRSITLMDANTIANGAFALPSGSLLYNLYIGYFGDMTYKVSAAAFNGGFDTKQVNLKIRGWALDQSNKTATPPTWLGLPWKTITEYK